LAAKNNNMKRIILSIAMLCTGVVKAQFTNLQGFEKNKYGHVRTVFTEEEAIKVYNYVMDKNGVDTLNGDYKRGENPVLFDYFKKDQKSNKVNIGLIISYEGVYDVLFMTIKDEDTVLFAVKDKNGELIDLIYDNPEDN
jgi:hypothetical protein